MFVNSSSNSSRQRLFPANATGSIVFIDPAVEDYQTLATGVFAGEEAIVLDPSKDGIEQISEVLSGRKNISSLHIVSNGQSGKLYLGNAEVSSNTLDRYSEELQSWAKSLTANADIFLYGCNVAAGEEGQQFIQDLSDLTGADIAASSDLTGSATRGGDWDLEVTTGGIESASAFQPQVLQSYQGLLDVGDGLRGEYFDNKNFTKLKFTRTDPTVNFNWGKGSPDASIGKDSFSVRWTGQVLADYTENYTFFTTPDDTAKLWINGQQIIDATRRGQEASGTIRLNAGQRYDVRLEYVENNADARVNLSWSSPSQSKQIIPQSRLFSTIPQGPGTISLATSTPPSVSEEAGKVALTVVRTGGSSGTVTVNYSVDDQTALAGSDYVDIPNGSVTFLDGETSKTIEINLIDDDVFESDETFTVGLLGTNGIGQVGTPRTATVTIVDDDSPSTVSFSQPTYSVAENGGNASITVERAGNLGKPATVNYATSNGTAIAPSDYTATSGTLSFAAGETTKTISIPIVNDALIESSETLNIALSNPGRRTRIGTQSTATLTIVDNDPSFTRQNVVSGLNQPTVVDWTPDGRNMFIAQKDGVVRVVKDGTLQSTAFINISGQVNNVRDRGLLGMAIHPNFATNPYVYLLFTYDPPEASNNINPGTNLDDPDGAGNRPSRLIRVTATTDPVTGNITAVPGSEVVLLGKNSTWEYTSRPDGNSTNDSSIPPSGINNGTTIVAPQTLLESDANNNLTNNIRDYLATDSESHTIGAVHFGSDGALYVSNGDGTSYNFADPRTVRVQDLNNLSGKILRIDPITGAGLSDNPFFNGADGADNNRDKVFDYGVRNSFRFTFDPVTGLPVIGDVGWSQWEEINTGRGVNFGWPYYEGGNGVSLQQSTGYANLPEAQAFYNSGQSVTAPIYARSHANGAIAIIMGDFYDNNRLIFGDVGEGNIYEATLDQNRNISAVRVFDSGLPNVVDMEKGPDGNMYGVNLGNGTIFRWVPA
ncbi:DUF4347 domain-containing protein [Microseira wollei]|uniref:PA14 domain-containing protein n=1 Tax=Microseira wollei NIES-4236 TaxID=2530354 RepID=A0AAV3XLR4_9CYAN|nr:DUF4347 domain-containing protein [Microseira wollei]GET42875.1 PA14 domain-containing protein [Microseira wollei NIES-4236]